MNATDGINRVLSNATELASRGEFSKALGVLEPLAVSEPNDPRVLGVLAGVYFRQDRFEEAARYFRRATERSPRSELASLGLFHALWKLGEQLSAEQELTRFLSIRESEEYRMLLEEMGWRFEGAMLIKPA
ncbi:MAG TPA: tetratricopeptide repeat protein [Polyangiaceae bacterium]|nr:tetratricopeptide repeat protein [Polyangiaceae bacterium]